MSQSKTETMEVVGVYSLGLCGYEIGEGDSWDTLKARFVGTEKEHKPRTYKIQYAQSGRAFIRPDRRRIYLDEIMRVRI